MTENTGGYSIQSLFEQSGGERGGQNIQKPNFQFHFKNVNLEEIVKIPKTKKAQLRVKGRK